MGHDAAVLEFRTQAQCVEVQKQMVADIKSDKLAAMCFKKIGGKNKDA